MGLLEDWGVTADELNEVLASRPSLRGMLMGYLAEYKLPRTWFVEDDRISNLARYDNHDRTKPGDFVFSYRGHTVVVEVKCLDTNSVKETPTGYVGKFQCNASDTRKVKLPNGKTLQTNCLVVGEFDLLAVGLFQFGHTWRFAFAKNVDLPRSTYKKYTPKQQKYLLAGSMKITWPLEPPFRVEPFSLLDEIIAVRARKHP